MGNRTIQCIGIGLLVVGLALTSLTASPFARAAGALAVAAGFIFTKGFGIWARTDRHPVRPIEKAIYALAAALFIAVFVAASLGYFNDVLTYSFAATFSVAVGFALRRVFFL